MRLVTWNCNGAFRRKLAQADALNADVLVIQECEDPAQSTMAYRDWAGDYAWCGNSKSKGIGIFPRSGQSIECLKWPQEQGGLFLPVRLDNKLTVLGVWTLSQKLSRKNSYIAQFWHYLKMHRESLSTDTVICGDLNSNKIWDPIRRVGNHSDCVKELGEKGFRSLYHATKGECQGEERQPTFYHHRSKHKPYHIDYVFVHDTVLAGAKPLINVGEWADWIEVSDHMPLAVDLELR